ncbi:MAG: ABC transporter permease [Planctomycetes bacterium]|nr:ABC transporter permease [Planctomycetota bacterium]
MFGLLPWEYGVRNLLRAPLRTGLTVFGLFLAISAVLTVGSFARGLENSLLRTGSTEVVLIYGLASDGDLVRSTLEPASAGVCAASLPGVATVDGRAALSLEVHSDTLLWGEDDPTGQPGRLAVIRGVTPAAFLVHEEVAVVEGRFPGPGELLVGRLAGSKIGLTEGELAVGRRLRAEGGEWTISGIFAAPGTAVESEIWAPLHEWNEARRRQDISAIAVRLAGPESFPEVDLFCKSRLDLELMAQRESEYYSALAAYYGPIRGMAWAMAAIVALGGLFGGSNTIYAAFKGRIREIGTLESIGWRSHAVALSLVQESLLQSALATLLASGAVVALVHGAAVRFTMGAFRLEADAHVLSVGIGVGLLLGLLGALPAAVRAARMPIPEALRA